MKNPLLAILRGGSATQRTICPELPETAIGLPAVTDAPCSGCKACETACPMQAVSVASDDLGWAVTLDRGICIGCGMCTTACSSRTLVSDRSTRTAVRTRAELVLSNRPREVVSAPAPKTFLRSLHIREVSTGCNATDQEVNAATNPIFDVARFGVHFVASPRYADALLVTGPVGRAMQTPLRRAFDAMAEPRIVIAVGTAAISGGLHRGGYADANGIDESYPIAAYVPGCPPHPWSIIHGILLAMGHPIG